MSRTEAPKYVHSPLGLVVVVFLLFYFLILNYFLLESSIFWRGSFLGGSDSKVSDCNAGDPGSICGSERFPWRRKYLPIQILLPGKAHEQRSLVGYSPWSCKELDTT